MFKENKYTNWYFKIQSSNAKKENIQEYTEQHPYYPIIRGRNTNDNIVRLSLENTFIYPGYLLKW
jgi:hypothetical protein